MFIMVRALSAVAIIVSNFRKRNAKRTLFLTLFLTLTFLLGEIHVDLNTLCKTYFESMKLKQHDGLTQRE